MQIHKFVNGVLPLHIAAIVRKFANNSISCRRILTKICCRSDVSVTKTFDFGANSDQGITSGIFSIAG